VGEQLAGCATSAPDGSSLEAMFDYV
jgi:hypothetical protein